MWKRWLQRSLVTFWQIWTVLASALLIYSFSFSSRWHRSARKGPYTLCPVSRQSPQGCPRNSADICLVDHRLFLTSEGGMSAASFLHSSFLQAINAVMLWPVHVQKVPQACESCSRAWTQLDGFFPVSYLLELCETAHMLDWLFCLAHPWLASCPPTPLFFFDSIVEWILGILHCTEIRFDWLHLMSCFDGWQVQ